MKEVILAQSEQITRSLEVNKDVHVDGSFDEIILCGMGGSGHPGDLLNALHLTTVPLIVHRSYGLPHHYGESPLVIVSSYSGNTEEALSSYMEAKDKGYAILVNTSGGTLSEWAQRDHVPWVKIDFPGMQPRHTLFASFVGLAVALKNSEVAHDITEDLTRIAHVLEKEIPQLETAGRALAEQLRGSIPCLLSTEQLAFAAQNFKIQMNENAKYPAFWNYFPELNHNEMVGFSKLAEGFGNNIPPFHAVFLRDASDHVRNQARMDVTKELYEQWGVHVTDFSVKGKTLVEKIFYAVSFGLWVTYYLAMANDVDPVPVEGVENFKARLKEVAGEIK